MRNNTVVPHRIRRPLRRRVVEVLVLVLVGVGWWVCPQCQAQPPLLHAKMVADESLIQQSRRLSDKVPNQRRDAKQQQEEFNTNHQNNQKPFSWWSSNATSQASIVFASCDPSSSSKNTMEFKLSSGAGHGVVCLPIPLQDVHENEAVLSSWPLHVPQLELQIAPGARGILHSHSFPIATTRTTNHSTTTNKELLHNCFGLSDSEGSIGFPFDYSNVPPEGSRVQVSCTAPSATAARASHHSRTHKPHKHTPKAHNNHNHNKDDDKQSSSSAVDFVVVMLDQVNRQEGVVVESFLQRIRIGNRTKTRQVVRPTLVDSTATIRGVQVEAFESPLPLPNGGTHRRRKRRRRTVQDDSNDDDDDDDDDNNNNNGSSTSLRSPRRQHMVHVQINKIMERVLDGRHDNVLAIVGEDDWRRGTNNTVLNASTSGEWSTESEHPPSTPATTSADDDDDRNHKDLVVVLHYEVETHDGHVYQRSHLLSTPPPPSPQEDDQDPAWWSLPWWQPPPVQPVWIESTNLTQEGDVQVSLAGLPHNRNKDDQHVGPDHRRLLCTIRVGLVVLVAANEPSSSPPPETTKLSTQKKQTTKPTTATKMGEKTTPGSDRKDQGSWVVSSEDRQQQQQQQHSIVDVAAMVTPESPLIVVHVGWIRRGLDALDLSDVESGWDVDIEDVVCQDPNNGYQITHRMSTTTTTPTEHSPHGHRRRLFADHHQDSDRESFGNSSSFSTATSTTTLAARRLLSQVPTQEERDVHDEMRMGRRPRVLSSPSSSVVGNETNHGPRRLRSPNHKFILVHGYCSQNTWPVAHFSSGRHTVVRYEDPYSSSTHDQFAYAIRQKVCPYEAGGMSGNIVAHSQGGAAALHMHNFYWSCLDNNQYEGRWIQTLGTPFQGTNLAGMAASMGAIFGLGCGSVHDLTEEGAENWLDNMQPWARKRVTYYRTQYEEHKDRYNYCHMLTHALIGEPNDGVVRVGRGVLPGGINGGVKAMQCHAQYMRDPPQVDDSLRNAYMKSVAAIPR